MPHVRTNDEFVNRLPSFVASKSKDFPGFLIVNCPREDCPSFQTRPFVVHQATWMRPLHHLNKTSKDHNVITGRPCPYCQRVARLPRRSAIR